MKETFIEVIKDYNQKLSYSEKLLTKVLVWTEDYEKAWYMICDKIPDAAKYFWVNRFGTYVYIFERMRDGEWKLVDKGKALTREGMKRITIGPAFKEVPPVLEYDPMPNEWL